VILKENVYFRMRYNGQRALQAAVISSALQASDFKVQLDLILSPLINTLSKSKNPANALAQRYSLYKVTMRPYEIINKYFPFSYTIVAQTMLIFDNQPLDMKL
jgi:hypothetical protein